MKNCFKKCEIVNLEESLVEDISVLLPVLPQDNLAEVRVVYQSVNIDFIGHVDHLLFTRVQAEGFHGIKGVLILKKIFLKTIILEGVFRDNIRAVNLISDVLLYNL